MIVGKIWGQTEIVLRNPIVEIHRLKIKANAFCSTHKHQHKWNGFYVVSGFLYIEVEKNNYALTDTTPLGPGQFTTVPPGEFHRFRTGDEETVALEIYYPEQLTEDIIRKDHGGTNQIPIASAKLVSRLEGGNNNSGRSGAKRVIHTFELGNRKSKIHRSK